LRAHEHVIERLRLSIGRTAPVPLRETRDRLTALFGASPRREHTFEELYLAMEAPSAAHLAVALDQLAREGRVRRVFRVGSSRSPGGLADFASIVDIPAVLPDGRLDEPIEVDPDFIRPIFRTP
jgi:hypothetical protein